MRLKKDAELLQKGKMNVSEVAYPVGFNQRKYFSEEFENAFGKTPSEYVKIKSWAALKGAVEHFFCMAWLAYRWLQQWV